MAFTPTDPLKAEVRVVGEAPNQQLDFYIPRGPKGDPGGLSSTVIPLGTDLDGYVTAGSYSVTNGIDAGASASAHLPFHEAGTLLVTLSQTGGTQIQTYITNTKNIYIRRRFNSAWSAWRSIASTRVDETIGRRIFTYDDANSREQMTFGDTGRRAIVVPEITGGTLYLRRTGTLVSFNMVGAVILNNTSPYLSAFLPVGFRPYANSYFPYREGTNDPSKAVIAFSNGDLQVRGVINGAGGVSAFATWDTIDAWPTTLPGTASGSIPAT